MARGRGGSTYIGGGIGITSGGLVSMRDPGGAASSGLTPSSGYGGVTSGGGGGGGGSGTSSLTAEQQAAQAKAAAEAKAKAEAEAKAIAEAQAKADAEMQKQIQSRTLAGQVSQQKVIEPYRATQWDKNPSAPRISFGQAFIGGVKDVFTKKDSSGGFTSPFTKFIAPFKYTDTYKGEKVAFQTLKKGSISPTESPYQQVTYFDIQKQREASRLVESGSVGYQLEAQELAKTTQAKISAGGDYDKSVSEYQTGLADINVRYTQSQKEASEKYPNIPGVYERTGTTGKLVQGTIDFGVGATSALLLTTPATAPAGFALGTGYFTGKGVLGLAEKPTRQEAFTDIRIAASDIQSGVKRDELYSPLYETYRAKEKQAALDIGTGALVGLSYTGQIQKSIIAGELEALGASKVSAKSIVVQDIGEGNVLLKGVQTSGKLKREINIVGKYFQQGDRSYILPKGEGTAFTTGTTSWSYYPKQTYVGIAERFQVGSKGTSFDLSKGFALTVSKDTYRPLVQFGGISPTKTSAQDLVKQYGIKTGGKDLAKPSITLSKRLVSKEGKEIWSVASGEIRKGKGFYPEVSADISGYQLVIQRGKEGKGFFEKGLGEGVDIISKSGRKSGQSFIKGLSVDSGKSSGIIYSQPSTTGSRLTGVTSGFKTSSFSQFTGTGTYERSAGGLLPGQGVGALDIARGGLQVSQVGGLTSKSTSNIFLAGAGLFDIETKTSTRVSSNVISGTSFNVVNVVSPKPSARITPSVLVTPTQTQIPKQKLEPILEPQIIPKSPRNIPKSRLPPARFKFAPIIPPGFGSLNLPSKMSKKSQIKRQQLRYQPSLTASVLNIKGRARYLGKNIGYSPFEIRGLDVSQVKRSRKKSKKKKR